MSRHQGQPEHVTDVPEAWREEQGDTERKEEPLQRLGLLQKVGNGSGVTVFSHLPPDGCVGWVPLTRSLSRHGSGKCWDGVLARGLVVSLRSSCLSPRLGFSTDKITWYSRCSLGFQHSVWKLVDLHWCVTSAAMIPSEMN